VTKLIELREWATCEVDLTAREIEALRTLNIGLTIQPVGTGRYAVEASNFVGALATPEIHVVIEPKLPIERVFFLLAYARRIPFSHQVELSTEAGLVEGFIAAFVTVVRHALRRGLLYGYRGYEESAPAIRGRIRLSDQVTRRFGLPMPVEISYDDYTPDTDENRLVKAALHRASQIRLRSQQLRRNINETLTAFETVSDLRYDPRLLPIIHYTRLNERHRPAVELARLIVANTAVELHTGATSISGLLIDMNQLFEDFVYRATGDRLRRLLGHQYRWLQGKTVYLDEGRRIHAKPDLSLWRRCECLFVGDAKYKKSDSGEASDLYQLLAYCIATNLPTGALIYADAPQPSMTHRVVHKGPELVVESLDLSSSMEQLERRCDRLTQTILTLARAPQAYDRRALAV
jgi:5-methylcytosine-specific restriction enzyme subunit McrC